MVQNYTNCIIMNRLLCLLLMLWSGYGFSHIQTHFQSNFCIKPYEGYTYHTCNDIKLYIEGELFIIPKEFKTDLASIPRIAWPLVSPAHSAIMRAAIVHDWFYRMTCDFDRKQTDLIFYHILRNDGVSRFDASVMYYAVRLFGASFYNEDYC